MNEEIKDKDEQETCPSKNCKRAKFDPPKSDCTNAEFHWLLAGKMWALNDDGDYHQVDTKATREEAYDGLLSEDKRAPRPKVRFRTGTGESIRITWVEESATSTITIKGRVNTPKEES